MSASRPDFRLCGLYDGSQPASRWLKRFEWEVKVLSVTERSHGYPQTTTSQVPPSDWLGCINICLIGPAEEWAEMNEEAKALLTANNPTRETVVDFRNLLKAKYPVRSADARIVPVRIDEFQQSSDFQQSPDEGLIAYYRRATTLLEHMGGRDRASEQTSLTPSEVTILDTVVRAFIRGLYDTTLKQDSSILSLLLDDKVSLFDTYDAVGQAEQLKLEKDRAQSAQAEAEALRTDLEFYKSLPNLWSPEQMEKKRAEWWRSHGFGSPSRGVGRQ